jgi:hypothetical protein
MDEILAEIEEISKILVSRENNLYHTMDKVTVEEKI